MNFQGKHSNRRNNNEDMFYVNSILKNMGEKMNQPSGFISVDNTNSQFFEVKDDLRTIKSIDKEFTQRFI